MAWTLPVSRISEFHLVHRISRIAVRTSTTDAAPIAGPDLQTGYTFVSSTNDDGLASFSIDNAPGFLFSTIKDIQSVNQGLNVHLIPWSPVSAVFCPIEMLKSLTSVVQPPWMKTSNSMNGGEFIDSFTSTC